MHTVNDKSYDVLVLFVLSLRHENDASSTSVTCKQDSRVTYIDTCLSQFDSGVPVHE